MGNLSLTTQNRVKIKPLSLATVYQDNLFRVSPPPFSKGGRGGFRLSVKPNPPQSPFRKGGGINSFYFVVGSAPLPLHSAFFLLFLSNSLSLFGGLGGFGGLFFWFSPPIPLIPPRKQDVFILASPHEEDVLVGTSCQSCTSCQGFCLSSCLRLFMAKMPLTSPDHLILD